MVYFWPLALTHVAEGYISAKRIQEFLLASERKPKALDNKNIIDDKFDKKKQIIPKENGVVQSKIVNSDSNQSISRRIINLNAKVKGIVMKNMTATWESGDTQNCGIYNFNMVVPAGELCAVVGPVGAGE